jgi:hypothetical protein
MLLFMDSFDHYVTAQMTAKWTQIVTVGGGGGAGVGSITIAASAGRRSSGALRSIAGGSGQASAFLRKTITTSGATAILGFGFRSVAPFATLGVSTSPTGGGGNVLATIRSAGTEQVWFRFETTGRISAYRGSTLLGTSTSGCTQNLYQHLQFRVVISATVGTVDVWIDAVNVLSLTGQNTQGAAGTTWDEFSLGSIFGPNDGEWDYDDLCVLDGSGAAPWNAVLGDCRVDARYPTAAGATTGWTPSAGSNWQNVDDLTPNDDTDYNSTLTVNAVDTFVTQDAPVSGAAIYGVQHCLYMKKTDVGTCTVAPVIRHAGVDNPGAALSPSTGYGFGLQVAQTNPGTGAQWTEAGFNAAEFGYKRTA